MAKTGIIEIDQDGVRVIGFDADESGQVEPGTVLDYFENEFFTETSGSNHLVLDLSGVNVLNSASLSPMIERLHVIEASQGRMAICGVDTQRLIEIFSLTKFDQIFDIYENRNEAIEAVQEDDV